MGNYLLRRLLIAVPSLLGISIILFTVLALAPGDPFEDMATNPNVPPEVRLALRAQFGLDDPVWQRYTHWLASMLKGDWGFSFVSRIDVDTLILQRVPVTVAVIGSALILALLVALPVGILAAVKPYSWFDRIASTLAFIGFSLPTFFTGLLFILFFSIKLDWFPFVFRADIPATGWAWWWEHIKQGVMPVSVLGLALAASWMRYVRSSVLDVVRLDYVTTARSKGLTERVGDPQARGAQRADPGGHAGGAAIAAAVRRRHRHRADLPHPRHRLAAHRRHPAQRHAGDHGRDLRAQRAGDPVQPVGRHRLWLARSPHQLSLNQPRAGEAPHDSSLWAEAWRRFKRHRLAYWSLWVLGLLVLAVLLGPVVYKVGINDIDFKARLAPPSWAHPLGTDDLGRDLLARVLYGGRISLAVGFAAMVVAIRSA